MGQKIELAGQTIMFGHPRDEKLLKALGILSIRHGHLDHVLRMTIKTIMNLSVEEALDATKRQGSAEIRKRIEKLAFQKLGEGEAFLKLQALLTRAQRVTEERNEAIHNLWAVDDNDSPVVRRDDHSWEHAPTAVQIEKISAEIMNLSNELNLARLDGFLFLALEKKKSSGTTA